MMIVSEVNIKLTILGTGGVGKTSIVQSYLNNDFPSMYIPTIGSSISRKEYKLQKEHIRVNLWDIGGQRSFNPLNPAFFTNIDATFLVFDLSNPKESLIQLQKVYLEQIREKSPDCLIMFLGNKSDLIKPEAYGTLINILNQYHISEYNLIFTSAKTHNNINEAFELMVFNYLTQFEQNQSEQFKNISRTFLNQINKNEDDIREIVVNIESTNSSNLESKITPKIRKKVINESDLETEKMEQDAKPILDLDDLIQVDLIKENLIKTYHNNLAVIDQLLKDLKSTPINGLIDKIDEISEELIKLKDDFSLKMDSLVSLNSGEIQEKRGEQGNS